MSVINRPLVVQILNTFISGQPMNCVIHPASCKQGYFTMTKKIIIMTLVVLIGIFFSYTSWATCTATSGAPDFNLSANQFPPLDPRTPINGTLAQLTMYASNTAGLRDVSCTTDASNGATLSSDFTHLGGELYDTGLPGIAMRIKIGEGVSTAYIPGTLSPPGDVTWAIFAAPVTIELIRSGDIIEAGNIAPNTLTRALITGHGDFNVFNVQMLGPLTVTLLQPTCSAITPTMTVDLGTVSLMDFNPQGRTMPKDFTIDLDCTGVAGTTGVYVTLSDASNPGNNTTQLNLSPDSDALGIALEVHNQYGVVSFGPDLSGTGNPGQWFDGIAGIGSYSIPLSVNYVRLPGPIKGGSANSGVTYTLNYD